VPIVEDAAHAIGTEYRGEPVGRRGTVIFSFHPIKTMTTIEGGMVCSDDEKLLVAVRRLKFHGLGVDAWDRSSPGRPAGAEVVEPGFKYNLTDVSAVLGLGQLLRLDGFIRRREELAAIYGERLAEIDTILPLAVPEGTTRHARALYVVRLDTDRCRIDRDGLMARLREREIGTGLHFRPAHRHAYYRARPDSWRGELPNTDWNADRVLSLPLFPDMTDDDVHRVVDELRKAVAP
jgi:UDP-4-amino-4-deoxy-L-arabinose-oxoglutarate aminotransferase